MPQANPTAPLLDKATLRELRQRAHALKPVVRLGQQGLTEAVSAELDIALAHHELVKVKLAADDKPARDAQLGELLAGSGAQLVQQIGHTATLWRKKPAAPAPRAPRRAASGARKRTAAKPDNRRRS